MNLLDGSESPNFAGAGKEGSEEKKKFVGNVSTCCKSMPNLNFSYKTINQQNQTTLKYKNIKEY